MHQPKQVNYVERGMKCLISPEEAIKLAVYIYWIFNEPEEVEAKEDTTFDGCSMDEEAADELLSP